MTRRKKNCTRILSLKTQSKPQTKPNKKTKNSPNRMFLICLTCIISLCLKANGSCQCSHSFGWGKQFLWHHGPQRFPGAVYFCEMPWYSLAASAKLSLAPVTLGTSLWCKYPTNFKPSFGFMTCWHLSKAKCLSRSSLLGQGKYCRIKEPVTWLLGYLSISSI